MSSSESDTEGNSMSASSDSSSSDDYDEDDKNLDDLNEKDFLKTLSCLKNKDPQIYDKNVQFFKEYEVSKKRKEDSKEKPMFLRDYERDILSKHISDETKSDDHCDEIRPKTYNEEQNALKESFKNIVHDDSSDDDENNALLKKKDKSENEVQEEEKDYIQWLKGKKRDLNNKDVENELKPLHEFWNNPSLDAKEEFLKDYILNKRYMEKDSEGNFDDSGLSEDEKQLEAQENFEHNYNFRFGGDENKDIKRYPRNIEGSMRRKSDGRKQKRMEVQKRKLEEKEKKKLVIKRKQKEKLKQIKEKIEKLKEITGNSELGFKDDEIMEDFDPEKYDKRMEEVYNDDFYSEEVIERPDFSNYTADDDDENWNIDDINMDCDADTSTNARKESRSKRKRKKKKSAAYTDICDVVKPVFDPEKHNTFQKYIDQYYNLDCEDFIDDIPCRFKYRDVVPNDFGLSVEEILMADDKDLNKWVSSKKIFKIQPKQVEKNEVNIYKQKSRDTGLKMKLLPSLYDQEEEEEVEEVEDKLEEVSKQNDKPTDLSEENTIIKEDIQMNKNKRKRGKQQILDSSKQQSNEVKDKLNKTMKKKNIFKKRTPGFNKEKKNSDIVNKISDNRLLAYNIKPKLFRSKLKHS